MNGLDKILDEIKMESDEVSASIIKEAQDKASEIARQARQKGEEAVKLSLIHIYSKISK